MTTTDKNKLIAEFMGEYNVHDVDGRYVCNNCGHEYSSMLGDNEVPMIHSDCKPDIVELAKYHTSWDWLMPVVVQINATTKYTVVIQSMDCYVYDSESGKQITFPTMNHQPDELINSVNEAVIQFIQWYNENQK